MTEETPKNETPKHDIEKFEERHPESMPVPVDNQQTSFFASIERLAANPAVDVSKIKEIMDMQEHILDRQSEQAFNSAMVKAQSRMTVVLKTTKGEHGKFANLESVLEMARPIYTDEGFAVTFYEGFSTEGKPLKEGYIRMVADIMHADGYTKTVTADVPFDDKGPQGKVIKTGPHATGSSFAYGRRYLNCMIWNIATGDDDDGRTAGKPVEHITTDMQTEINDLLKSTKSDKKAFLKFIKAESIETIPLDMYERVKSAFAVKLEAFDKEMAEPGSNG